MLYINYVPICYSHSSAVSNDGQTAPRTGIFLVVKSTQIMVKEWDPLTEDAVDMNDKDQEARIAMGMLMRLVHHSV